MKRLAVLAVFLWPLAARADAGRVRLRADAGPFEVTIFTPGSALAAGPVEIGVLIQDRSTGDVLTDAEVDVEARGPRAGAPRAASASGGPNRLLRSAVLDLPESGRWIVTVRVRRGSESASVSCPLDVGPPASRLAGVWPLLAFPPFAVLLFAARSALRPRRSLK